MKIRKRFDRSYDRPAPVEYPTTRPVFQEVVKKDGSISIEKVGEENFFQATQEAVKDTLIYNLIDQYERTLDGSIFGTPSVGGFIDTTSMPKDLMQAENVRAQAKQLFESLPADARKKYGNDFTTFLVDINAKLKDKSAAVPSKAPAAVPEGGSNGS